MSDDFIPKPGTIKIGGLSRAAQKLQSAKEKAASKSGGKNFSTAASGNVKAKDSFAGKKTNFQRKAV